MKYGREIDRSTANAIYAILAFGVVVGLVLGIGGCALVNSGWLPTIEIHWSEPTERERDGDGMPSV